MPQPTLVVVTPWYPSDDAPYHGVFVQEAVAALRRPVEDVLVVHLNNVAPADAGAPRRFTTGIAEVLRIDVPVPARTSRADTARAQRRALLEHRPRELDEVPVVHAHVGMPTGWAVAGVLPASTRLVTTEHATYLPTILRTPVGERMYGELLARTDRLLTVGEKEARDLRTQFPAHAAKVFAAGNPVDQDRFALRPAPPARLDRWVYVGNLIPRKGVDRLVRAFALWSAGRATDDATLTLVGTGPQEAELRGLAAEVGVGDQVRWPGAVAPDDLPGVFADADVLLHLSSHETFGLTVVEAAMTGLPVVVTRCGGPTETLSDAEQRGLVRFVDVAPEPADVVRAVRELERSAPGADAAGVREVLVARHGARAFAERLERALDGRPPSEPPAPGARTVVGVALSPYASARLVGLLQEVVRSGGRAVLVTSQRGDAVATDRRIEVVDLAPHLTLLPHHALPDLVLRVLPAALLRAARSVCSLVASVPGPPRRIATRGVHALSAVLAKHAQMSRDVHAGLLHPVQARIDRDHVTRHAMRRRAGELTALRADLVVAPDDASRGLGSRIAHTRATARLARTPSDAAVRSAVVPAGGAHARGEEPG
ncbi:glycosyltransferase [Cellulomonas sp. APG4]|uniref:glycosyltransferase n=1 Tax=Cellulomonas sp. APG4 TaxID=1538656 RepID=UPI00137B38C0|nr:glycosyltransferase [Cellulomonas sp. APG4]